MHTTTGCRSKVPRWFRISCNRLGISPDDPAERIFEQAARIKGRRLVAGMSADDVERILAYLRPLFVEARRRLAEGLSTETEARHSALKRLAGLQRKAAKVKDGKPA